MNSPPLTLPWHQSPPDAVAFDMDGTLLNSGDFGVRAIRLAFEQMIALGDLPGLSRAPADELIRAQIGKPPHEFYADLLPPGARHLAGHLHSIAGANERAFLRQGTGKLFEGALDVLGVLRGRGLKLLLVSNCTQDYMNAVVQAFALDALFHFRSAVGRDPARTKTGELGRGLAELGATRAIMVGDRHHDGEAARAMGAWFVACTYGYGKPEELAGADATIGDIRELPALL
ncbi:MAG: HAD family hydrolase [Planctomycetes bacterium]|nr:HAD family hydrolase [Planctomycetota bacterium]